MSMYYSGNGENAIFRKSIFESGECQPDRPQQVAGTSAQAFLHADPGHRVQGPGHG